MELRKEYVGYVFEGSLYVFRIGVFLPPNTSYGEKVGRRNRRPLEDHDALPKIRNLCWEPQEKEREDVFAG